MIRALLTVFLFFTISLSVKGQTSILYKKGLLYKGFCPNADIDTIQERSKWEKPGSVALQSALLPGLGQVTNGQIWKVPIIYAGGGIIAYFIQENHRKYIGYRNAYRLRVDGDSSTIDKYQLRFSDQGLLQLREMHHSYRDLTVIIGVVAYAANILDAYVYAHLKDFDVSENLSLQVQPMKLVNIAGHNAYIATLKLNLK